eukprot:gene154-232_t
MRMRINYVTLGLGGVSAMAFVRCFFEPRVFTRRLTFLANAAGAGVMIAALGILLTGEWQLPLFDRLYSVAFPALISLIVPVLYSAWRRGSEYLGLFALATPVEGVPPFRLGLSPVAFGLALGDAVYRDALFGSLRIAGLTAGLCLLAGYPMALAIARSRHRALLLALVVLPFWSGYLLRVLAWIGILRDEGWLNGALLGLGIVAEPLPMLHSDGAMLVGLVYTYLPFLILPLEARLAAADPALEAAAADLGATPWRCFLRITLPLSLPGVWAGLLLVFVPVAGEVVIPSLLGAPESQTLGRAIWEAFFAERDWPQAAALAMLLLALAAIVAMPASTDSPLSLRRRLAGAVERVPGGRLLTDAGRGAALGLFRTRDALQGAWY